MMSETPMERLKWLLESFDKKYVETLFEEGEKVNLFAQKQRENFQYQFNGWVYTISRYKALDPQEQLLKRMGL